MIVADVKKFVVDPCKASARVTLQVEASAKGPCRGVPFMNHFILGHDHETGTTVSGTITC